MKPLLDQWDKEKKENHSGNCHKQWKYFSTFILSVDSMIGRESQFVLPNLSRLMAAETEELILHMRGWVNDRIIIVVMR